MKKVLLIPLLIIYALAPLSCACMDTAMPTKSLGHFASIMRMGRDGFSYMARACKAGLSGASRMAKLPLEFASSHKKLFTGTCALVAAGLAYGVGKVYRRMANADEEAQAAVDGHGVAALAEEAPARVAQRRQGQTANFQTALSELCETIDAYDEQLKETKGFLAFSIPTLLGLRELHSARSRHKALPNAIEGGLKVFSIASNIIYCCANPLEYFVRSLAHLPSPHRLNSLRALKVREKEKWENIESIIRHRKITTEGLDKLIRDGQILVRPTIMVRLRKYIAELEVQRVQKKDEKENAKDIKWIGTCPDDLEAFIYRVNKFTHAPEGEPQARPLPHGILMLGKPGTGKSHAARYIEQETGCNVKYTTGSEIKSKWVGEAGHNIRNLYEAAARQARETGMPAIIFIDEADVILRERKFSASENGDDTSVQEIQGALLPILDGNEGEEYKNVLTICATNVKREVLDPAIVSRGGRFAYVIRMPLPDLDTCRELLINQAEDTPQIAWLAAKENEEFLNELAMAAHNNHFSHDNMFMLINNAVDFAISAAQKAVKDELKERVGNDILAKNEAIDATLQEEKRIAIASGNDAAAVERAFKITLGERALRDSKEARQAMYQLLGVAEDVHVTPEHLRIAFRKVLSRLPARDYTDDEDADDDRDLPEAAEVPAQAGQAQAAPAATMPDAQPVARAIPHSAAHLGRPAQQMSLGSMFEQFVSYVTQQNPGLSQQLQAVRQVSPVVQVAAVEQQVAQQHHGIEHLPVLDQHVPAALPAQHLAMDGHNPLQQEIRARRNSFAILQIPEARLGQMVGAGTRASAIDSFRVSSRRFGARIPQAPMEAQVVFPEDYDGGI